jgi:hypothetical protein
MFQAHPPCARWLLTLALVAACSSGGKKPIPTPPPPDASATDASADQSLPDVVADAPAADRPADLRVPSDAPPPDGEPDPSGGPQPLGARCETSAGAMVACADGLLCCKPCCDGRPAVCTRPVSNDAGIGNGRCPLPDLTVSARALRDSVGFGPMTIPASSCEAREECADSPGTRNLLHFEVTTPNIGSADLVLGSPLAGGVTIGEGFIYSRCHQHYHFAGYALYQLFDASNKEVVRGKKRAFCLEDFGPLQTFPLPRPMMPRYTCDNQGISVGWADTYANGLTCQYIDLTGLPPGRYTLRVTVNPDRVFPELTYDNNTAETPVDVPAPVTRPTQRCVGTVNGVQRECGWNLIGSSACTPGARVSVGCGAECGLGRTDGDPMLRVCDGDEPCAWPGLGNNDDCTPSMDVLGARVNFLCPPSGRYTVMTGPADSSQTASCDLEVR